MNLSFHTTTVDFKPNQDVTKPDFLISLTEVLHWLLTEGSKVTGQLTDEQIRDSLITPWHRRKHVELMVNVELVLSWSWELSAWAWRWLRSINQDRWDTYKENLKEQVEAAYVCTEASGWILQDLCSDLAKCSKTDWMTPQCTWTMSQTYCMDNPGAFLRQRNGTLIPTQQSIEANLKANTQKAAEGSWRKWSNGLAEYHDVRGFETSGSLWQHRVSVKY